ncbi:hypothetical protein COCC4DRAFT_27810 [Bipolaris maydis ATCC 48331]|uniref:Uncharacterized protein n=2 Tax=Cochliobolus heterostrophus TaxID=5016 RepID=M2UBT8_COCH5|nr:uncharacterized protein COCC4DRAFT_27810 [Bipolaris maydis ATCC 48331]EMD85367.1 hypothetical protein COCHEDRAFT_1035599 [Bipolaris maydis C5]ENI00201.1 hypothetical protein COCC4DRAFT_27810 [Bipolaris maydis ATCC 48331]KAJ5024589.1 hypothetical protein J3E73DRAFT_399128 [Bipolaris maydis]KAJ6207326.1 hypothetical protein PSV09DRAFT_1035599 [Bipolaris maydis]
MALVKPTVMAQANTRPIWTTGRRGRNMGEGSDQRHSPPAAGQVFCRNEGPGGAALPLARLPSAPCPPCALPCTWRGCPPWPTRAREKRSASVSRLRLQPRCRIIAASAHLASLGETEPGLPVPCPLLFDHPPDNRLYDQGAAGQMQINPHPQAPQWPPTAICTQHAIGGRDVSAIFASVKPSLPFDERSRRRDYALSSEAALYLATIEYRMHTPAAPNPAFSRPGSSQATASHELLVPTLATLVPASRRFGLDTWATSAADAGIALPSPSSPSRRPRCLPKPTLPHPQPTILTGPSPPPTLRAPPSRPLLHPPSPGAPSTSPQPYALSLSLSLSALLSLAHNPPILRITNAPLNPTSAHASHLPP